MQGLDSDTQHATLRIIKYTTVALVVASITFLFYLGKASLESQAYQPRTRTDRLIAQSPELARAVQQAGQLALFSGIVALLLLLFLVGLLIYSFAIKKGSFEADRTDRRMVRILSRFSLDEFGNMCFDRWEESSPGAKLYVQVQYENGRERELMVAWEIFLQCGEGMEGMGVIEGNYLIGFVPPQVLIQQQPIPPDPFHKGP